MKTYYHVTLSKNIKSIMQHGLIPQIGQLSKLCNEEIPRIYLFPTQDAMEVALSSWLGENIDNEFDSKVSYCSLIIQLPDNFPIEDGDVEYECYCFNIIPPGFIKYLKEE